MHTLRPLLALVPPLLASPLAATPQGAGGDPAPAVEPAPMLPLDRYTLSISGALFGFDSEARLGAPATGVSIDLEEVLGLESSTQTVRLAGGWRFTENGRHRLGLSWLDLDRTANRTVGMDVVVNEDLTIPAGTSVSTQFDLDLYKLDYTYSIFRDDRIELGASIGAFVAPIDLGLQAAGVVDGVESLNVTAPLPVLGIRMDLAFTEEIFLRSSMDFFYLEYDGYTGSLVDNRLALEYRPWKNLGLGLGFESFALHLEHDGPSEVPGVDFVGEVDFDLRGLVLSLECAL